MSEWTHEERSNFFNLRIILSKNQKRFSKRCGKTEFDVAHNAGNKIFDPAPTRPRKCGWIVSYDPMWRFLLRFYHYVKEAFSPKD
ncbi:hypothetical protein [Brucella gallinifaecis]|uniref:hypothetical protein n=1 Tax=Brucella gallinifaecis TaxID=215590 RepID=UPI00235FC4B9|nr:hypothetical protein [Brucella gallinifaecis]